VANAGKPDLAVGLIRTREASERLAEEGVGIVAHVAEVTATIVNRGDGLADERLPASGWRVLTSIGS
jgi:hypothetical protein